MNHWPFVLAAYGVTLAAIAVLVLWSWAGMRRAEADVESLKR